MHGDDVKRVVVAEPKLQIDGEITHCSGHETDHDRREATDEARTRRDRHQTGDGAGSRAERGGMAGLDALDDEPSQHCSRGGDEGVEERLGRNSVGAKGRTRVEAEPAEPQDPGTQKRQG